MNGVAPGTKDLDMRLLVTGSHAETLLKNISLDSSSFNMTRLHPGTAYQFSLQLEDSLGYTSNKTQCTPCETKEAGMYAVHCACTTGVVQVVYTVFSQ